MKPFIYLVIFAIVFIIVKAFYFDSAHEEIAPEMNVTVENTQSIEAPAVEAEKNASRDTVPKSAWQNNEKLPVNKLGDSIAEKLEGKF